MNNSEQRRRPGWKRIALFSAILAWYGKTAFAHLRYSVAEESIPGTIIGNVIGDLGFDIKHLEDRGFRVISGSKQQLLQVNHKTGILFVSEIIDRELLCEREKACFINIKIVIENPLEIHQVETEIIDINDNSPAFTERERILEISELTQIGSRFSLDGAYDPDSGVNSLKFYQLSQNDHFSLEVKEGSKKNKMPVLVLQSTLDREVKTKHYFLLTAIDGGNPPRSGNMNITVMVSDVNDNAPVFAEDLYSVTLEENCPLGTLVLHLNASDLDEGSNSEIVYSLKDTVKSKISELFNLNILTGEITVKGVIDFEENELYEFEVKATDRGTVPMSSHCTVLIKIKDVNDNAPLIEITSLSSSVLEDVKPGTVVGLISITDIDSGINSKITCTSSENLPFEVKPSFQENLYSLLTKTRLDRESTSQYNITITAKDFGHPSLSSSETVSLNVLDVNDNPPRFLQDFYVFYIKENNTPGTSILAVSAVDVDANENGLVSYYLSENEATQKPVVPFLSINSDNGQVFSFTAFDFENVKFFTFIVIAKDSGVPLLSSSVTVTVFILDQNDSPPIIVFPPPTNGTAILEETIPRNVKAGYLVTRIRAYDADVGYNAWLSFSIEDSVDRLLFSVGRYTGEIRTLRAITDSDVTIQKMIVQVKDSGSVSFSASATVIVTVAENIETHAFAEVKSTSTREVQENNTTFYLIVILSSMSSLFIITVITVIGFRCHRARQNLLLEKYLGDTSYVEVSGSLFHEYQAAGKRLVILGPEVNRDSFIDVGSNGNTLFIPDSGTAVQHVVSYSYFNQFLVISLLATSTTSSTMSSFAVKSTAVIIKQSYFIMTPR